MTLQIRTNNIPRDVLSFHDLTKFQQDEVIDAYGAMACEEWRGFIYKGNVYDLGEFIRVPSDSAELKGWHGMLAESYFFGILVKYTDDNESVIIGQWFS